MRKFWIEIRSSLWFLPSALVLTAICCALGFVKLDVIFVGQIKPLGWMPFLNAGADGARGMLTAIASSMITVAGVAFSVTIVTLSLASTQYTPRILRNFMRDRANQSVLGVFVGIYTYCLIVLRTIGGGGAGFVPLICGIFCRPARVDWHRIFDFFHPSHRGFHPGFVHSRRDYCGDFHGD